MESHDHPQPTWDAHGHPLPLRTTRPHGPTTLGLVVAQRAEAGCAEGRRNASEGAGTGEYEVAVWIKPRSTAKIIKLSSPRGMEIS